MRAFADLLDRLSLTASRNAKLTLMRDYFRETPDPERGWALAALTGDLSFDAAKPAMIRKAVEARVDPLLFRWSHDYVGDLAETVALIWPAVPGANREPDLSEVVDALRDAKRSQVQGLLEGWLDALDADGRWALLKLLTGGLRVGVSARLARQALADFGAGEAGGPTIKRATLAKSSLKLVGTGFVDGAVVEIDGRALSGVAIKATRNGTRLVVRGTADDLGLRLGYSRVRVVANGLRSNLVAVLREQL